jgi:hypothetical protein
VLTDGPRAYWRLGEAGGATAADETGTAAGTYSGGTLLGAPGAILSDTDTAVRLDGVDDLVTMGDPTDGSLDFGTGDFSVEAWLKTTVNGERAVVSKRSSGAYWQFTVTDDSGHTGEVRANISDGAVSKQVYGPPVRVDDGNWHHVVVAFDRDSAITVFVDGAGRSTAGATSGSVSNAAALVVGKASSYGYFQGDLDEVAVYPVVLSAVRVQAHLVAGR